MQNDKLGRLKRNERSLERWCEEGRASEDTMRVVSKRRKDVDVRLWEEAGLSRV